MHHTTLRDLHDTDDHLDLLLKLQELEKDHDERELYPDSFMREYTDFATWDAFERRLAGTPGAAQAAFLADTTRFSCLEQMEGTALELLIARKFGPGGSWRPAPASSRERAARRLRLLP